MKNYNVRDSMRSWIYPDVSKGPGCQRTYLGGLPYDCNKYYVIIHIETLRQI
jgi:hypothetical protein